MNDVYCCKISSPNYVVMRSIYIGHFNVIGCFKGPTEPNINYMYKFYVNIIYIRTYMYAPEHTCIHNGLAALCTVASLCSIPSQ